METQETITTSTELVVFDFDETIVDCNSDTYINVLAPGGTIPETIWATFQNDNDWTAYMQAVFQYLGAAGVTEAEYRRCLATMPFVEGMKALLGRLASGLVVKSGQKTAYEVIVISDANSFFINYTLQVHQLDAGVKKVFTNPAAFDPVTGVLQMERYHEQNWCPLSARNLCKGHVLKEYIAKRGAEGVHFERVNYAGDGSNDLCPSLKLGPRDRVFPRVGYPLHKLTVAKAASKELQAPIFPFVGGEDIWKVIVAGNGDHQ
ncbi:Phospho-2-dehydro-3-deoxyheptonate aldolase AroG [Tyrophagus putrescentiae]|nr:Phospho-2-dehydro-3-deoxyheptonate aldolase AroG [Tyrophagus putrescentiae]